MRKESVMRDLKILKSITNRNEESLSRYLNDIGQIKMIDPKEEVRLAKMIREGECEGRTSARNSQSALRGLLCKKIPKQRNESSGFDQ